VAGHYYMEVVPEVVGEATLSNPMHRSLNEQKQATAGATTAAAAGMVEIGATKDLQAMGTDEDVGRARAHRELMIGT
jgi:hypothetical protein